jgi:hypothetical protein
MRRLIAACCALVSSSALAQALESVLSPGPVIEGHAKVESECRKCHIPFRRDAQDGLCLDCHKETAVDVRQHTGLHGRQRPQPCRACHTDHRGRDAKIASIDERTFDHDPTDFALRSAHADPKTQCRSCHMPGKKYREAPGRCIDCHAKKDVHKGRLGNACADCHNENNWKETDRFDHDKTRFALRGKHAPPLKCESCHKDTRYKETPTACIGCHKKEDKHEATLGEKCADCHTERDWKASKFDHDKTKFHLRGGHAAPKVKCDACHKDPKSYRKTPTDCYSCHRKDDKHKGILGNACADCHTEKNWKETGKFDHDKTRFPLRGKHAPPLKCESCHKDTRYKETPTACIGCHKKEDKHEATLGEKCADCHTERDWKASKFDHDKTKFHLRGGHAAPKVKCDACHKDPKSYRKTPTDCQSCHERDDVHEGQQGTKCESCHDDDTWKKARFDHARARFPLVGGHLVVACDKCHATQRYKDAKSECIACHDRDDVHKRRLGTRCEACHNARTWKSWDFNHDRQTKFRLDGAHRKLDCLACHRQPVQTRATLPTSCVSCHAADDVHDGGFGRQCEKCHVTASFKQIKQRVGMSGIAGLLARACETPASRVLSACGAWAGQPHNWER